MISRFGSAILGASIGFTLARLLGRRGDQTQGAIRFGTLRSIHPVSTQFGWDRGLPVDRYYIEDFLARHSSDIRGRVLE